MKIKTKPTSNSKSFIVVAVIGVFILSFFILIQGNKNSLKGKFLPDIINISDITTPTSITYSKLFNSSDYELYSDSNLSIYIANTSNIPKIIYRYKKKPTGRELSDNFFIHVYVKDTSKLRGASTFVNVDFKQSPKVMEIDGVIYHVFQKDLTSNTYKGSYIPVKNIAYINTGRFQPKAGRSLNIKNLSLENIPENELQNALGKININISQKAFDKIKTKRKDALSNGVLISQDDDLVNGRVALNNEAYQKVKLRLKGDWTDHLKHENKWSYRIIMKGDNTFKGMRKFSIQHPVVRNYLWEWLFNKAIKDNGLIGLRYDFANVNLTVKGGVTNQEIPMGIMAIEESFDKILIENNKKREGLILGFDESLLWKDREKQHILSLENSSQSKVLHTLRNAQIKIFNENKVLANPKLLKQFKTAKDLLEGLRQGKYKPSEVFDVDRLATFIALTNLFGGYHGLIWHNLRIYYNPITNKLEPIAFDSNSGLRLTKILKYPLSTNDKVLEEKVLEKLKLVSSSTFINDLITTHNKQLEKLKLSLSAEYNASFDIDILAYNSNFIKKHINPAILITSNLLSYDTNKMSIEINNVSEYPVTIEHLADYEGRVLGFTNDTYTIKKGASTVVNFNLSDYFVNAFISKKNKKGSFQYPKDVQSLRIAHSISGIDIKHHGSIKPYGKNPTLNTSIASYKNSITSNYDQFPFILKQDSTLILKKGTHTLQRTLIIPSGFTVVAQKGFALDLTQQASIHSRSPFQLKGTADEPIRFYSTDHNGGGIFITNAKEKSKITYCIFDNLSNPQSKTWSVSGAVNFHESDVSISNTTFSNNHCEDGLNIIRSAFTMTDTRFEGTQSDAFDGDFVTGTLERCTFLNAGNDGIDISGSELIIKDIIIKNPLDKGISAGEHSSITGENIRVFGGEIGVVSKDLSTIDLNDVSITGTRLGLSAFQKKSEYGIASIAINSLVLNDIEVDHLIEVDSRLTINKVAVETVSHNVIDQMYGKEYGKSSK